MCQIVVFVLVVMAIELTAICGAVAWLMLSESTDDEGTSPERKDDGKATPANSDCKGTGGAAFP